jgi:hypothetical protein
MQQWLQRHWLLTCSVNFCRSRRAVRLSFTPNSSPVVAGVASMEPAHALLHMRSPFHSCLRWRWVCV